MSGPEAGIWTEGTYLGERYIPPSDVAQCFRCGIWRRVRPDRNSSLCRDCLNQQAADDKAWLAFHPVPAMSDDDREWCRKQEARWFWTCWEKANRRGDDSLIGEAMRRTA